MSMQGYVIRTVSTFDDSMLRRRDGNIDPEDQISPKGAMEFPDVTEANSSTQKNPDKKNTSMISKASTSSSRSLKRNLSDSQLVAQMSNKSMHSWKCSLCFHNNLNTMLSTCAMCGTDMDASFMAALNALDNLKDPSVHNDEDDVESGEDSASKRLHDKLFPASFTDRDNSFRTADEEDATFVSFQTAQQSVNMRADVSTINPETVGTSFQGDVSLEDEHEAEQDKENRPKENSSNKSETSGKAQSITSVRDTVLKLSQSLMDISVGSSITMQNQNSVLQNSGMPEENEMQSSDALVSKSTVIDTTDDSIHTLLNVTRHEEEDEFDPMLFQRDDALETDYCCGQQVETEFQEAEYRNKAAKTPVMKNDAGHSFAFEKEIELDEFIQKSQQVQTKSTNQSFDVFPYVPKTESESMKVDENNSKSQVQTQVPMGDHEQGIVQEQESFVNQNIWRIRKTVAVAVAAIVLVSIFALA